MKALVFHGKQQVRYESIRDAEIVEPTDVIVKMQICAICGSDMHPYHEREKGLDPGTAMGHEFVGEVVAKGRGVHQLEVGSKVFSPFTTSCGQCFFCKNALTARCVRGQLFGWIEQGVGLHGGQAEYVRVPLADSTLAVLPEDIRPEEGLLLGDVLSTGYFCAENAGVSPGAVCVVIGCGPVGLMAVCSAKELGADTIYAVDSIGERLQLAHGFGAIPVNFLEENAAALLRDRTDGIGADAVMEVVGSELAAKSAFDMVRPGGTISTVGVHTEKTMAFSPAEAYDKNITYKVGRCPARHYIDKLIPFVRRREHDLTRIFTHRMNLSDGSRAYQIFDEKKAGCTKIILTPD